MCIEQRKAHFQHVKHDQKDHQRSTLSAGRYVDDSATLLRSPSATGPESPGAVQWTAPLCRHKGTALIAPRYEPSAPSAGGDMSLAGRRRRPSVIRHRGPSSHPSEVAAAPQCRQSRAASLPDERRVATFGSGVRIGRTRTASRK